MTNSANKRQLIELISNFNIDDNIAMIGEAQIMFEHEEADVSSISYLFFMYQRGKWEHIQVHFDDTDILLFLVYF